MLKLHSPCFLHFEPFKSGEQLCISLYYAPISLTKWATSPKISKASMGQVKGKRSSSSVGLEGFKALPKSSGRPLKHFLDAKTARERPSAPSTWTLSSCVDHRGPFTLDAQSPRLPDGKEHGHRLHVKPLLQELLRHFTELLPLAPLKQQLSTSLELRAVWMFKSIS